MRARLRLLGVGIALVLAQQLVAAMLPPFLRPDFVLVLAIALGLMTRGTEGLIGAFCLGWLVDLLSGSPPGFFALLRGTACAATRLSDRVLYLRAAAPWALYVGAYAVVDVLLGALVLRFTGSASITFDVALLLRVPVSALLTALVALPMFALVRWLDPAAEGREGLPLSARGLRA